MLPLVLGGIGVLQGALSVGAPLLAGTCQLLLNKLLKAGY
jgi:hypothetical protein